MYVYTKKDITEGIPDEWLRMTSQEPPRIRKRMIPPLYRAQQS